MIISPKPAIDQFDTTASPAARPRENATIAQKIAACDNENAAISKPAPAMKDDDSHIRRAAAAFKSEFARIASGAAPVESNDAEYANIPQSAAAIKRTFSKIFAAATANKVKFNVPSRGEAQQPRKQFEQSDERTILIIEKREQKPPGGKDRDVADLPERAVFEGRTEKPNGGLILKWTASQAEQQADDSIQRSMQNGQQGSPVRTLHLTGRWSMTADTSQHAPQKQKPGI